ncbi:uncharacterized protein LOC119734973 [Patiria miniata]|uniref:Arrestin C-terminal-like domain-containing protein n=1 Tax=Patiria miniata TaxID=46514 RepID=A0A914ALV3_PATMI|nr:uncharacterized protein LOC119734973 [Patiria miniata]XP_038064564.1 uncharacterized protein LOC119734973 [Patiria miniata]XP_038064565.1 uncharacterized protein LOC119734973 [Patiria miniata]
MNEIAVRTHQGEYYAGEIVYGMIYLKVATADFTEKIQLQISGIEQCDYVPVDGDDWSINHSNDCLRNPYTDKVMANPVEILAPKEPLPVGYYKFPFHYKLKPKLPSTTSISCPKDSWHGSVTYRVTATAGDKLSDTQTFVCLGKRTDDVLKVAYMDEKMIKTCFCYDRGGLSLMAELDKSVYTTGETMQLSVNVNNKSSELAKSVKCWLKRTVWMYGCWVDQEQFKEDPKSSLIYATHRGDARVRLQDEVSIDAEEICYKNLGSVTPKENRDWTYDIHLSNPDGSLLPPSTIGSYLRIAYCMQVHVSVPRATDLIVTVPVTHVLPSKNTKWLEWRPESWMQNCQMLPRHDKLAVRNSILESPIYEGLL